MLLTKRKKTKTKTKNGNVDVDVNVDEKRETKTKQNNLKTIIITIKNKTTMKTKIKFLAMMLMGILLSVNVWGETVTSTFTDKDWHVGNDEAAWNASGATATAFESASPSRGVQVTLANIQSNGLTLTNTSIQELGAISKVEIVYSSNCTGTSDGTIAVAVGSTAFGDDFTIKKENDATISFENATPVADDIVITFTSSASSKSVYVKSITVTYEGTGGDCTERTITFAGSPTTVEKTTADAPFQYIASIDVADGQTISYSSSNTDVATVASDGTVTIVGAGETTIKASVPKSTDYCRAEASYTVQVTKVDFVCWDDGITLDFTKISFDGWASSYATHEVDFGDNLKAIFNAASKQGSTITDCPVSKDGYLQIDTKGDATMSAIHLVCKQWTDKAQTLRLKYCTEETRLIYEDFDPAITSTNFEIERINLPVGTTGVEIDFEKTNQIGIVSACVILDGACTKPSPALAISASMSTITTAESSTLSITGGNGGAVTYEITSDNAATGQIEGNVFTATAVGQYTIKASQAATDDYCAQSSSMQIEVVAAKHTVNWYIAGVNSPTQVAEDAAVVFPSNPEAPAGCEGKSFYGWAKSAIDGEAEDDAPTVYTSETMGTEDINFYAVFADKEGSAPALTKLGSGATFTAGENIVVVASGTDWSRILYQETANTSYVNSKVVGTGTGEVALTAQGISADVKNYWTLSAGSNGTWILGDATNGYLLQQTSANEMYAAVSVSGVTTTNQWTIAWDETNSKFTLKASRYLCCRSDLNGSSQYKWRGNGTTISENGVYYCDIYKLDGGGATYSNYVTSCATYTVTFKSNGAVVKTVSDVAPGQQVTAPTLAEIQTSAENAIACSEYLIGWSSQPVYRNASEAPSDLQQGEITIPNDITSDVTYHAVYADVKE